MLQERRVLLLGLRRGLVVRQVGRGDEDRAHVRLGRLLEQLRQPLPEVSGDGLLLEGERDRQEAERAPVEVLEEGELDLDGVLPPVRLRVDVDEAGELDDPLRGVLVHADLPQGRLPFSLPVGRDAAPQPVVVRPDDDHQLGLPELGDVEEAVRRYRPGVGVARVGADAGLEVRGGPGATNGREPSRAEPVQVGAVDGLPELGLARGIEAPGHRGPSDCHA